MRKRPVPDGGRAWKNRKMKSKLLLSLLLATVASAASAQVFNSLIANPFVFCSAPKPCRVCQPWRRIYQEICAGQPNAGSSANRNFAAVTTPVMELVDQDGQRIYRRVVGGWTIQSQRRADLEDENLEADVPTGTVEVIDGPVAEAGSQNRM